jgi:3-phosphoshikimate 1-carboxyvinyltransferase
MGTTRISGLLESEDVISTRNALAQLGTNINTDKGDWLVEGVGFGGFLTPDAPLDLGNSGTGARLLMGVLAGSGISAVFTGDKSLSSRPMARITAPLMAMGAKIEAREDGYLPVTITAPNQPLALHYDSPVASAQIKSAILLAGLTARGETIITEPKASRDHTETMLRHFGIEVVSEKNSDGRIATRLIGEVTLNAQDIAIPADPSSAAFLAVAALITPDSDITLKGVGINPLRFGLFETLIEMGGDITLSNPRIEGGENIADMRITTSPLTGITVPAERTASMIDEYPILNIAAAHAKGTTHMIGIEELRLKETDRIEIMAAGLTAAGVKVETTKNSMTVHGTAHEAAYGQINGGVTIDAQHDHRIAMSFLILGLTTSAPMTVSGAETIATSFPNFAEIMRIAGARIMEA